MKLAFLVPALAAAAATNPQAQSYSLAASDNAQSKYLPVNFCFSCGGGCGGGCSCGGDSGCGSSGGDSGGSDCSSGNCGDGSGPIVIGGHGGGAFRLISRGPFAQLLQQQHAQMLARFQARTQNANVKPLKG